MRARFDLALVAVLSDGGVEAVRGFVSYPGATLFAGTTAAGASPSFAPRPTRRPPARWWPSPPPPWRRCPPSGWRGLAVTRKCSGGRNRRSPGRVEGDREGRGASRLGVVQRAQRPRRHGQAHGPERRAHPRDRTPGPLEAGRRHGRPLHPRRIRRVGAAVSIM